MALRNLNLNLNVTPCPPNKGRNHAAGHLNKANSTPTQASGNKKRPHPGDEENQRPHGSGPPSKRAKRQRDQNTDVEGDPDESDYELETSHRCYSLLNASRKSALISAGRHFTRTVALYCDMKGLIDTGLLLMMKLESNKLAIEELLDEEQEVYQQFRALLTLDPLLEHHLIHSTEDTGEIAKLLLVGCSGSRSDDTKSMKGVVLDWINPDGQSPGNYPKLRRNTKDNRGFFHPHTGIHLCPVELDYSDREVKEGICSGQVRLKPGDYWPSFLYENGTLDPADPFKGLFKGDLLIKGFKHIFTSPSSVTGSNPKSSATKTCNAGKNGMRSVTLPSVAYIATQVRFALSSANAFNLEDQMIDSSTFYDELIKFMKVKMDVEQQEELLGWWNRTVFPLHHAGVTTSVPAKFQFKSAAALFEEHQRSRTAAKEGANTGGEGLEEQEDLLGNGGAT